MRLILEIEPEQVGYLPSHYRDWLRAVVYRTLQDRTVHDAPCPYFTFSMLRGNIRFDTKRKEFHVSGPCRWEVRFIRIEDLRAFKETLRKERSIQLGKSKFWINSLETPDVPKFNPVMHLHLDSPVTTFQTSEGKRRYFHPAEGEFYHQLEQNARFKYNFHYGKEYNGPFELIPTSDEFNKNVSKIRKTYVTSYYGRFDLKADEDMQRILYLVGLGSHNASGHGMTRVIHY